MAALRHSALPGFTFANVLIGWAVDEIVGEEADDCDNDNPKHDMN